MTIKKKTIKKVLPKYTAVLDMAGNKHTGEGETIFDALTNIPLDYINIKAKGVITVSNGKKSVDKLFFLRPLRILFVNKLRRHSWAKNFQVLLNAV